MPTVTLSRSVVDELMGKKYATEELKERIAMVGTDLEKIDDKEIVVEIFPNRPDMLSESGFSRALRSFLGIKTGLKEYTVKKSGEIVIVDPSVAMRPYTACAIVKNLTFTDEKIREIMQAQEKLATTHGRGRKKSGYGIYPLEHITFPVTYTAKDPEKVQFHALGFETTLAASEVIATHPKAKEYKHITHGWKKYPFFIDAKGEVMSLLPFTNSDKTGKVTTETKDVFIECSGIDFQNVSIALNILVTMLADMGGEIYTMDVKYGSKKEVTPNLEPKSMNVHKEYVNKILGLSLTEAEIKKYLAAMGYGGDGKKVLVPAYRADILHERDLVEDIAIAYGYENVQEVLPPFATLGQEDPKAVFCDKISQLLVGLNMFEVSNFHLIDKNVQTIQVNSPGEVIEILDPVSMEYNSLRKTILPSLLQTLRHNKVYEYPQKFFEIGTVFTKDATFYSGAKEELHCGIVLSHQKTTFTEARQVADYILRMLGLDYQVKEASYPVYLQGRAAKIIIKNEKEELEIGTMGELHPKILENFGLEMTTVSVELNLSLLWEIVEKKMK